MQKLIFQLQLLLTALGALLPFVPEASRARVAVLFDLAGKALLIGDHAAEHVQDLAEKLARIRVDVEAMASEGRPLTADQIDEAWARVDAASRAFREAAGEA